MQSTGVDLLTAVGRGEAFVKARAHCRSCRTVGKCKDWFLEGGGELRSPPGFCPNVDFFKKCKETLD